MVFNDPIHGSMELTPLLVKIIDTPQFQRLRYIKQLGAGYLVYPGASHNRFEHSIGVGSLGYAMTWDMDPFPMLLMQCSSPKATPPPGPGEKMKTWKHEDASVEMFDYLVRSNEDVQRMMKDCGLELPEGLVFIKEMIKPPAAKKKYKGRPKKSFLYEIVANKRSGIDVDKFDYFARDSYHLGIKNNFDMAAS
ncbi:Deoxynucleoside triphosphate triphosphohydrolase SAMHD1 [Dissostichus eleginoides]|uniref:Deoxynucleoside triphosphate triphosphohydrolase SAMHD1 n=1 Tax=Dissostichus eleginoides TaxID=100907 RepID=A0AAD9C917_DISEL|nr:Deoxynucleoside triphosphate triphosphohydrolase SAMHD1 [Dissostichus eleginoides]